MDSARLVDLDKEQSLFKVNVMEDVKIFNVKLNRSLLKMVVNTVLVVSDHQQIEDHVNLYHHAVQESIEI